MINAKYKFRGISKDTKKWIYGYYINNGLFDAIIPFDCFTITFKCGGFFFNFVEVLPETIGMFTGQYDKNNDQLWEGDTYCWKNKENGYITYDNGCFYCNSIDIKYPLISMNIDLEKTGCVHNFPS